MVEWLLQNSLGLTWLCHVQEARLDAGRREVLRGARRAAGRLAREARGRRGGAGRADAASRASWRSAGSTTCPSRFPTTRSRTRRTRSATLKLLDPAVRSGHFLVIAFDLLAALYREEARHRGRDLDGPRRSPSRSSRTTCTASTSTRARSRSPLQGCSSRRKSLRAGRAPERMNLVAPVFSSATCRRTIRRSWTLRARSRARRRHPGGADRQAARRAGGRGLPRVAAQGRCGDRRGHPDSRAVLRRAQLTRATCCRVRRSRSSLATARDTLLESWRRSSPALLGGRPGPAARWGAARGRRALRADGCGKGPTTWSSATRRTRGYRRRRGADTSRRPIREGRRTCMRHSWSGVGAMRGGRVLGDGHHAGVDVPRAVRGASTSISLQNRPAFARRSRVGRLREHAPRNLSRCAFPQGSEANRDLRGAPADTAEDEREGSARPKRKRAAPLAQVGRHEFDPRGFAVIEGEPIVYWWTKILGRYAAPPSWASLAGAAGMKTGNDDAVPRAAWEVAAERTLQGSNGADAMSSRLASLHQGSRRGGMVEPQRRYVDGRTTGLKLRSSGPVRRAYQYDSQSQ